MKSKVVYFKQRQKLVNNLLFISEEYFSFQDPNKGCLTLPLSVILNKCAEAWGVSEDALKGKINHANELEKISKYCFLYGCELFNAESTRQDEEQLVGYTRGSKSLGQIMYQIRWNGKYSERILNFIQSLIDLAPKKFKILLRAAERQKGERERKTNEAISDAALKDYVAQLEGYLKWANSNADFYRNLYMTELNRPNRVGALLHQPLIGPNVTNMMYVIWQTCKIKKGVYVDRLDKNRIYEFVEAEQGMMRFRADLDKNLETFMTVNRN